MNLPEKFIEQLRGLLPDEWEALAEAITTTEPSVAVRVNEGRGLGLPEGAYLVPWCGEGFYLNDRPSFTFEEVTNAFLSLPLQHIVMTYTDYEGVK